MSSHDHYSGSSRLDTEKTTLAPSLGNAKPIRTPIITTEDPHVYEEHDVRANEYDSRENWCTSRWCSTGKTRYNRWQMVKLWILQSNYSPVVEVMWFTLDSSLTASSTIWNEWHVEHGRTSVLNVFHCATHQSRVTRCPSLQEERTFAAYLRVSWTWLPAARSRTAYGYSTWWKQSLLYVHKQNFPRGHDSLARAPCEEHDADGPGKTSALQRDYQCYLKSSSVHQQSVWESSLRVSLREPTP